MAQLAFAASIKGTQGASTSTLTSQLGIQCAAQQAITIDEVDAGFDGTNSANGPGTIDIAHCTYATNAPGTNSTSLTTSAGGGLYASDSGRPETIQSKGGRTWTGQPTVIFIWKSFFIPSYMGSALAPLPLMKPMICKGGGGVVLNTTLPSAVTANCVATILATE